MDWGRFTPRFVPPISLILATWSAAYVGALTAFRHDGAPDAPERSRACHGWLRTFASATLRACRDAQRHATEIESVEAE